jgi:hypothetical protein
MNNREESRFILARLSLFEYAEKARQKAMSFLGFLRKRLAIGKKM